MISQKSQYALRAIFELAKRRDQGPTKIAEIAKAQAVPPRFLEVILNQLKQAGFVESRRGSDGGYLLVRHLAQLSVGEVIEGIQGSLRPVDCLAKSRAENDCRLRKSCVFMPMWEKVHQAMNEVYRGTTFQHLVEQGMCRDRQYVAQYSI